MELDWQELQGLLQLSQDLPRMQRVTVQQKTVYAVVLARVNERIATLIIPRQRARDWVMSIMPVGFGILVMLYFTGILPVGQHTSPVLGWVSLIIFVLIGGVLLALTFALWRLNRIIAGTLNGTISTSQARLQTQKLHVIARGWWTNQAQDAINMMERSSR
ncbi:MAG: hypothetical protein ABF811_07760 [Pseudoclavibacter sp.]